MAQQKQICEARTQEKETDSHSKKYEIARIGGGTGLQSVDWQGQTARRNSMAPE